MKSNFFSKNFYIVFIVDTLLLLLSLYWAYLIRFDFNIPSQYALMTRKVLPFILIIKFVCLYFFDLYRGMWRYTSIADLVNIIKATTISTLLIICLILFGYRFKGFSRSVFVIDWCFNILFISGFRLVVRYYFEYVSGGKTWQDTLKFLLRNLKRKQESSKNLLIIGAGDCGEKIYREIRDNSQLRYNVVGFLDDHQTKVGKKIHGIPVLNNIAGIKAAIESTQADEALIAIPSATSQQMRTIIAQCQGSGIKYKTMPSMGELINGHVTVNSIRDVAYRDLLGREIIQLDEERIGAYLRGQCVLVTGAGGSIGSELCRQICRFDPEKIILCEIAESPLYEIDLELKEHFSHVDIVPLLADIQSKNDLEKAFEAFKPHTVFHAAAYKHVPMMEMYPWKAVNNNIVGTLNVVECAKKFAVNRFVFVSTDKAVRPTNVMGTTKRITEMMVQNQNSCGFSETNFMTVRFGNVVGSNGSVIPLFKKQIAQGGPVTVTHPDVTRFFMTIPEACQLILQAGAMGEGGEIFILDMGTPIKIDHMARDLIRFSGFEPDVDIKIEYVGLRPGEKLYEELITKGEGIIPTNHKKIMVLKGTECNLKSLHENIKQLVMVSDENDIVNIKAKLQEIVPEYEPYL